MADDIVSKVRLEGTDEVVGDFTAIGAAGKKAFADVAGATAPADKSLKEFNKQVKDVERASRAFSKSITNVGTAAGNVASNVGRIAGTITRYSAAVLAYIGIASKLSKAQDQNNEDTKEQVALSNLQAKSMADAQARALQNAKAHGDLNRQLAEGEIGIGQYTKALVSLQREQREEEEQARQLELIRSAEAEQRIRAEAQIKKEAAARKAYAEAVQAYGADTASALVQFGAAWERFNNLMNQGESFIASIIRGVANLLNTHGQEINDTFNRIGDAFAKIFDDGSGKATDFATVAITIFRQIADAILNYVIPAFQFLINLFRQIAAGINAVFGTDISGEALLFTTIIFGLIGGFKLLFALLLVGVAAFKLLGAVMTALSITPMGLAIRLLVVAIVALIGYLAMVNWKEFSEKGKAAWETIKAAWNTAVQFFTDVINGIVQLWDDAWTGLQNLAVKAMTKVLDAVLSIIPGLKTLIAWLNRSTDAAKQTGEAVDGIAEGAGGEGFKRGGPIRGRGSSTSDNVPIWASPGEWMMRARAVQYYGRGFMAAVNSLRFPRDGFDLGGVAGAFMPVVPPKLAFAQGGEIPRTTGRALNLTIGEETFNLITRDDATAERLSRYVASRRIRSAGRKPSSYGA